jgi:hypothetical protein
VKATEEKRNGKSEGIWGNKRSCIMESEKAWLPVLVQPKKQAKWESEPTGHSCTPSSEDPSDKNVNLQ